MSFEHSSKNVVAFSTLAIASSSETSSGTLFFVCALKLERTFRNDWRNNTCGAVGEITFTHFAPMSAI